MLSHRYNRQKKGSDTISVQCRRFLGDARVLKSRLIVAAMHVGFAKSCAASFIV